MAYDTTFQPQGPVVTVTGAASQVNATGLSGGGNALRVVNATGQVVYCQPYLSTAGTPTVVFPASGTPSPNIGGAWGFMSAVGTATIVEMPAWADSVATFGFTAAAGNIYFQRGDGR